MRCSAIASNICQGRAIWRLRIWLKVKEAERVRHQTLKLKEYDRRERVLVTNAR